MGVIGIIPDEPFDPSYETEIIKPGKDAQEVKEKKKKTTLIVAIVVPVVVIIIAIDIIILIALYKQGNRLETDTSFFTDSDIEQRGPSDHSITATHNAGRCLVRDQADIEQKDIKQKSSSKEQDGSKQHSAKRSDTNLKKKDLEPLKDEMNMNTKKSEHQSKDTRKSSKQRQE
ncbi:MAG: hypothetical protein EZS28_003761 [Streblomastix strix]|uniref:Uncharacterized protein n=1 Tax=Streblomastix strix TaxID=222440 RepID=A0A5J4X1U1_9EUKA|nr:MAG: hypothetical protein EZS28_003761 [Streblomastix strix]